MKKMILFGLIWCMVLSAPIEAKKKELTYRIYFDSNETELVTKKEEIIALTQTYFDYVEEESTLILLEHDLTLLEGENRQVRYRNYELIFILGDGKGEKIKGNFKKNSFCMEEVKPISLFQKWFKG